MFSKVAALTLVASAAAQTFSVVRPSSSQWWVAESVNTLQWSPCDAATQAAMPAFNVVIRNDDQTILAGNLTLLGNEPTFECSKDITPPLKAGTGYTVSLTNAINTLQVYASNTFEVKAKGSEYPPQTSSSATPSGSSTASGSSPSPSGSGGKSGAGALEVSLQSLFGTVLGAGALGALL